ncbi:MAG TPA: hypothetical protein VHL31_10395 [Geminicoccus sp.]|uniref:hypothetical protein n=1 Tax=Geminicoccus sp. TaxID=2024832 RepID=UPI002E33F75E|nr:hypothetical protein [Geminicoccus sp.]HEX2526690.1 hypothetical protein [Geminicoccus sp.]
MAKAYKIPKKIAGVKVPRALRKSKSIRKFLKDPDNRQMITSALMAAGGALATALAEHRPGGKQVKHALHEAGDIGSGAAGGVQSAAGAMGNVVAGAARSLASTLTHDKDKKHTGYAKGADGDDLDSSPRH